MVINGSVVKAEKIVLNRDSGGASSVAGIGMYDCYYINDSLHFYPANIPANQWSNYTFAWCVDGGSETYADTVLAFEFKEEGLLCGTYSFRKRFFL